VNQNMFSFIITKRTNLRMSLSIFLKKCNNNKLYKLLTRLTIYFQISKRYHGLNVSFGPTYFALSISIYAITIHDLISRFGVHIGVDK